MQISNDGEKWREIVCAPDVFEFNAGKIPNDNGKVYGKCIVIHKDIVVFLLKGGVLTIEILDPDFFKLFVDYEIHPEYLDLVKIF